MSLTPKDERKMNVLLGEKILKSQSEDSEEEPRMLYENINILYDVI